jgi:hypothetical protein
MRPCGYAFTYVGRFDFSSHLGPGQGARTTSIFIPQAPRQIASDFAMRKTREQRPAKPAWFKPSEPRVQHPKRKKRVHTIKKSRAPASKLGGCNGDFFHSHLNLTNQAIDLIKKSGRGTRT